MELIDRVFDYIHSRYRTEPEHLWRRFPCYAVFRHGDNRKWFALIMDVPREKLGLDGSEVVNIINLKLSDPMLVDFLTREEGYFRGYHISRGNWVSILLDGTVPFESIANWIDESYLATASKSKAAKLRGPKEWIVPANPKYFDILHAFDENRKLLWKQGRGIRKKDTVYLYAAAPVSAILYRCTVSRIDIPYEFHEGRVNMDAVMELKLEKRYSREEFTFQRLKSEYGIKAIRGPITVPHSLMEVLSDI